MKFGKMEKRVLEGFINGYLEMAAAEGRINPAEMSDDEIQGEILNFMESVAAGRAELSWVIDHTKTLLRQAREHSRAGRHQDAALYFATWIEHAINRWIVNWLGGHGDSNTAQSLIRDTGIRAKYIWVTRILTGRAPTKLQIARLQRITELRNRFVHYKWRNKDLDDDSEETDYQAGCEDAEKLIKSMRTFEQKHFYKGSKNKLRYKVETKRG